MTHTTRKLRAVGLAVLMVASVFAMTVSFSGTVAAAANVQMITVTDDPAAPTDSIEILGDTATSGNITFKIEDPADSDTATVTKSGVPSGAFKVSIDLDSQFSDLNGGTATVKADYGSTFDSAEASSTFEVDVEKPVMHIDSPSDGSDLTSAPTIEGTASDDTSVETVEIAIQRNSDDKYFDGSSWTSSKTWLTASGTTDWSYDTSAKSIGDGSYDVSVRATDAVGRTRTLLPPSPDSSGPTSISYSVDTAKPTISDVSLIDQANGDGTVSDGDAVKVSVNASDTTAGIDTVTVDASPLGGSASVSLSHDSDDTYNGTFTVSDPPSGDGSVSLTATVTDAFGNSVTDSDSITLDTVIADADSLNVHADFLGVVTDDNSSIRVTASGIEDARGNTIDSGSATLEIAGTSYSPTASVSGGSATWKIDPTTIADTASTGSTTVEIAEAGDSSPTDSVTLVHEALSLQKGWQLAGTPMPASDVLYQNVSSVSTYSASTTAEWVSPNIKEAGEGYYVNATSDAARMGYIFDTSVSKHAEARLLDEGWNLLGAAPDLNPDRSVTIDSDLGDGMAVSDSGIQVQIYSGSSRSSDFDSTNFNSAAGSDTVNAFGTYWVYVDDSGEIRDITVVGYMP